MCIRDRDATPLLEDSGASSKVQVVVDVLSSPELIELSFDEGEFEPDGDEVDLDENEMEQDQDCRCHRG